ncbi:Integral membrane protein [Trichuris trichiura]|uniref:Integral membrane protein n=1 Tax=Trichuris trichiura TaxID=36087 RepID=A0A077ZNM1_TRITR|nr:Integral membrane protein [Trichuris trichiura]
MKLLVGVSSAGSIVENLSNKKMMILFVCLALLQIAFFLIGGLFAPSPSAWMNFLMRICVDRSLGQDGRWFYVRPNNEGCQEELEDLGRPEVPHSLITGDPRELVFVAQMPNPRDDVQLEYSRWFQSLLGLLLIETEYSENPQWKMGKNPELRLEVRMGYRNRDDPPDAWHELISTTISRMLRCSIDQENRRSGFHFQCEPIELFELGSCDYPFYLLNIRIPGNNGTANFNREIGRLTELNIIEIHQNGGFTKVWLSMKTILFPIMLAAVLWYRQRLVSLRRPSLLLEKCLFCLGAVMLLIDLPIEWLSLWFRMPFMLLFSDLRQGLFYAVLLSFWLIFAGEHLIDESTKNNLYAYWKNLSAVFSGCLCLFIFDACERGVHLTNPFYSIWSTNVGTNLAYLFIILAVISAAVYFVFLCFLLLRVMATIKQTKSSLNVMKRGRRVCFEAIIYRFKFLMVFTFICAGLTVSAFIMTQIGEGQLRWGDYDESPTLQYSSAFLTGVYGMWNVYTLCLLAMYAPSHKKYSDSSLGKPKRISNEGEEDGEEEDQSYVSTEMSALTALAKPAFD